MNFWNCQSVMGLKEICGITYLTFLLANDENAYSTSCEIVGEVEGSINTIAACMILSFLKNCLTMILQPMEETLKAALLVCFDFLMRMVKMARKDF